MSGKFSKIQFGDGLTVTDQGDYSIRVDSSGGNGGGDGLPAGGTEGQHLVIQGGQPAWFGFTTYASLKAGVTSYADILA